MHLHLGIETLLLERTAGDRRNLVRVAVVLTHDPCEKR
jgi:hypothetical protein